MADKLPTRDRILRAARHLFQRRGYYAVGTAEILEAARAPKGSMYHHFPGGKEQIAVAAVDSIRADVTTILRQLSQENYSAAESIRALAKGMAQWLKASQWREGTMLASTTVGSVPDLPKLHTSIRNAFSEWRDHIAGQLVKEGWRKPAAHSMAQTLLAGIEGAMMLARIDQDERIVVRVADILAGLIAKEAPT
ncbi:MAG TPA: TetR/AcrR family transcriptional regulator [Steroidobacteraceae bacterium]|nr:TetR/AcrR family transcriptional regulator [Steroidobacteraceae bacterium]